MGTSLIGGLISAHQRKGVRKEAQRAELQGPLAVTTWYAVMTRARLLVLVPDVAGQLTLTDTALTFVPTRSVQPLWSVDPRRLEVTPLVLPASQLSRVLLRSPGLDDLWISVADVPLSRRSGNFGGGPELEERTKLGAAQLVDALARAGATVLAEQWRYRKRARPGPFS